MNLQEAKALFFAQYLGQEVLVFPPSDIPNELTGNALSSYLVMGNSYLLLRSTNQLTDEELLIIARIAEKKYYLGDDDENPSKKLLNTHLINEAKKFIGEITEGIINWAVIHSYIAVYQYLLRIGILLPFTYQNEKNNPVTFTYKKIIKLGWAKIPL